MKRLIVNADDFGLTRGVNRAVIELNRSGALSSATLMASAPCFAEAAHLAFVQPSLATGCHVVLLDGLPVLPASEIPSLIDPNSARGNSTGRLRPTPGAFVRDLLRGKIRAEEIEAEAAAQIARVQKCGLRVTHLDTHKHTHMFRQVLGPLLRAAVRCEVAAIRNPFEPAWSRRAAPAASLLRRLEVASLRIQSSAFLKMTRAAGVETTGGAMGVAATGVLDRKALKSLLSRMPDGAWELVCHPGYCDSDLEAARTKLRQSRETERKALLELIPQAIEQNSNVKLIDFTQL